MVKFVYPKVYLVGMTTIDRVGLETYLRDTHQEEFLEVIEESVARGLSDGEVLCSFYAKLCYASLVVGKNQNISKTRSIWSNIVSTIESGHGSVFEHASLNFVITNCSRVFTHELVRHRVGTAFSQTSGRYVRTDQLRIVWDDILFPAKKEIADILQAIENAYQVIQTKMKVNEMTDFTLKKKVTSAMRRILPNGQANEIGFSVNLRALRHTVEMRTSRHAEKEIRHVFNQIVDLVQPKFPAIFADASYEMQDGLREVAFKNKKI